MAFEDFWKMLAIAIYSAWPEREAPFVTRPALVGHELGDTTAFRNAIETAPEG